MRASRVNLAAISILLATAAQVSDPSSALANPKDIQVSGPKFHFMIRGTGEWVCSARDQLLHLPFLGRAEKREDAEKAARDLASENSEFKETFIETLSCERSLTGSGSVAVQVDQKGIRLLTQGARKVTCSALERLDQKPFEASAGTKTEAYVLAFQACYHSNDQQGFFCEVTCS